MRDTHASLAELQAFLVHVQHDDLRLGQLDEFERREADWAGADDEARLLGLRVAAHCDGVAADGECLDEGELIERQLFETCSFRAGT